MSDEFIFYHPESPSESSAAQPLIFHRGYQAWILQAYQLLRQRGFPCTFTRKFPDEGIVIGFRTGFPPDARPTKRRFLVCVQADYTPFAYSNADIVQNPAQVGTARGKHRYHVPHFPQVGLTPRAPEHSDRFRKMGYFGRLYGVNHSPVLRSREFRRWLELNNFELVLKEDPCDWQDYSDVDVVVAIRSFGSLHKQKPATKLVNAWMAKVPAILGPESAYRALRSSELDYIEVDSIEATQNALMMLRNDPDLRQKMVRHGNHRAKDYTFESLTGAWASLLSGPIADEAARWFSDSALRRRYFLQRKLGGHLIDYVECLIQQRGVIGALHHALRRPIKLATTAVSDTGPFKQLNRSQTQSDLTENR